MVPIMASRPGPEGAKQPQTITLPPPCLTVGMTFFLWNGWFYARCNGTHTFQKVKLLSHQSTKYSPKSLGDNQDIFWQMWDEPLCSFWSAMAFALELSHRHRFYRVSFLLLNHEHWPELRQVRPAVLYKLFWVLLWPPGGVVIALLE